jgi:hypothetical protein
VANRRVNMTVADRILQHLQSLPESVQAEVLDFVEYLDWRLHSAREGPEEADWSALSLTHAMRGLEDEPSPYTRDDIKEPLS